MNKPVTYRIKKVQDERSGVKTFFFEDAALLGKAEPGQFMMVWVPGVDEIPISVSYTGSGRGSLFGITVQERGEATRALLSKKEGDYIGLRGPYGTGFREKGKKHLMVAGGLGLVPILPFAELIRGKKKVYFGVKNRKELFFMDRLKKSGADIEICTDDGSFGRKGFVTEWVEKDLAREKYDCIYTCGPEIMMYRIYEISQKFRIPIQASLERWMKCGFGICGHCVLDPLGIRVCKRGPVLDGKILSKTDDFGRYGRNKCGAKVKLGEL